ncbi:Chitinase 2 [Coemansia javaensis]|uniref:chitinase n=1 Tax=Coemansia javaensis TaxID=2761396 RepID=A0A9W8HF96_9FUNG|nr:Chitinase 2 [Coemansia javaensis]
MHTTLLLFLAHIAAAAAAYSARCSSNVVTYWGQNSWGGSHLDQRSNWEKSLASYCQDDTFDVINISFLTNFNLTGLPVLNHAFHCEDKFNKTNTLDCPGIGADVKTCQGRGKKIVLSLGGGNIYTYGLSTAADGQAFADTVWNMFLGGKHTYRPYGNAVLDGVDLDIESGAHDGYPAFINRLREHFKGASKQYIISAAPQCVYPDSNLNSTLSNAWIDNNYVQFYNNPCNLANIDNQWNFDYASWDRLAKANPNTNSKVYVGLPAGSGAAGNGYMSLDTAKSDLTRLHANFSSTFGGIMLWDASWYTNNADYVKGLSKWLKTTLPCNDGTHTTESASLAKSTPPATKTQSATKTSSTKTKTSSTKTKASSSKSKAKASSTKTKTSSSKTKTSSTKPSPTESESPKPTHTK